jgi:tubulin polyglutamylase TTLL6/13
MTKNENPLTLPTKESSDDEPQARVELSKIPLIMSLQQLVSLDRNPRKNKKVTINLTGTRYTVITNVTRDDFHWNLITNPKELTDDWNIQWFDTYISTDTLRSMLPFQKINHFPGSFELGRKNLLSKNISRMRKHLPHEYNFTPRTWLLPHQLDELKAHSQALEEKNKKNKPAYIVKPEASCQGRGIYMTKKVDGFGPTDHCVVQEYIMDPYLIDGLKFDLRIYALVKSIHPLKIFIYREGMARFSTVLYEKPKKKNMKNLCMHLTNYAVNKKNPDFQFDDEDDAKGHKRSFSSILRHVKENGDDPEKVFKDICNVVVKTIISVQPHLAHMYRSCQPKEENSEMCFELFGFDIMLDSNLKAWLLEVNHTPSFHTDSTFDLQLKQNLILDTLTLLNVNPKAKKAYMENRITPYLDKKFTKINADELEKLQTDLTRWEDKMAGGYYKIYPPGPAFKSNYAPFLEFAKTSWNEFTNPRKKADEIVSQIASSINIKNIIKPPRIDRRNSENTDREGTDRPETSNQNLANLSQIAANQTQKAFNYARPQIRDSRQARRIEKLTSGLRLDRSDLSVEKYQPMIYQMLDPFVARPTSVTPNMSSQPKRLILGLDTSIVNEKKILPIEKRVLAPIQNDFSIQNTCEDFSMADDDKMEKFDLKISQNSPYGGYTRYGFDSTLSSQFTPFRKFSFKNPQSTQPKMNLRLSPINQRNEKTKPMPVKLRSGSTNPSNQSSAPLGDTSMFSNDHRRDTSMDISILETSLIRTPNKNANEQEARLQVKGLKQDIQRLHEERLKSILSIGTENSSGTDRIIAKKNKKTNIIKPYSFEIPFVINKKDLSKIGFIRMHNRMKKGPE